MKTFPLFLLAVIIASPVLALQPNIDYVPGRAIINFTADLPVPSISYDRGIVKLGIPALDAIAEELGVNSMEKVFKNEKKPSDPLLIDLSRWYYITFPEEIPVEDVISAYQNKPFIEYAEYDLIRQMNYIPNDSLLNECWYIFKIEADSAWDITRGSSSIEIAFIDTGVDTTHEDLIDNLFINYGEDIDGDSLITQGDCNNIDDDFNGFIDDFWGWDFVHNDNTPFTDSTEYHGSSVIGCACATPDNEIGIAGVGFHTRYLPLSCGVGGSIGFGLQGINYASNTNADIISMSYGSSQYWTPEYQAIQLAWQRGCILVASAGNDGSSQPHYPAAYTNVIGVGSTDSDDHAASFSNIGSIDVMAPGVQILTTAFGNNYSAWDGTSLSTSIIAAACALIKSVAPESYTNADIVQTLFETCDDIYAQNPQYIYPQLGYGRINIYNAVLSLVPQQSVEPPVSEYAPSSFGIVNCTPNPFNNSTSILFNLAKSGNISLKIFDVNGREIQSLASGVFTQGNHTIVWNAENSVSGVYFVKLSIDEGQSSVKKVILMK